MDPSKTPPFGDACEGCGFCEQICPQGAIEMDWDFIEGKMTAEEVLARAEKNIEKILKEGGYK